MKRVHELKAAELLKLIPVGCASTAVDLSDLDRYHPHHPHRERCVDVKHRKLVYVVGCWAGWEGAFWMVEARTGIIFRGSLEYMKEMIALCSASYYEPNGTR